jgi:hypothetical protein
MAPPNRDCSRLVRLDRRLSPSSSARSRKFDAPANVETLLNLQTGQVSAIERCDG